MPARISKPSGEKLEAVEKLTKLLLTNKTIGVIGFEKLDSKIIQSVRKDLRGRAMIKASKNSLIKHALEGVKDKRPELLQLLPYIHGASALVFSNGQIDPFELSSYLSTRKKKIAARVGQIASSDVFIEEMNTGFPPGTIIQELNALGLKTKIIKSAVSIIDGGGTVCRSGDKVSKTLALILDKLGRRPFEVGFSISAAVDGTAFLPRETLSLDVSAYRGQIAFAHMNALNLSIQLSYFTEESIGPLLAKGFSHARSISMQSGYTTEKTIGAVLARARAIASNIKSKT